MHHRVMIPLEVVLETGAMPLDLRNSSRDIVVGTAVVCHNLWIVSTMRCNSRGGRAVARSPKAGASPTMI
jgi:hypothetical protein